MTDRDADDPTEATRRSLTADLQSAFENEQFFDVSYPEDTDVLEHYWVEQPYVHAVILAERGSNRLRYHVVEPALDELEAHLLADLRDHLRERVEPAPGEDVTAAVTSYLPSIDEESQAKLEYYAERDSAGYGPVNPLVSDPAVDQIACNGVERPVYVAHEDHGNLRTNVAFEQGELAPYVTRLAQYGDDSIGRTQPTVSTRLPNGATAQLTLGEGTAMRESNFTLRKHMTTTPVDLLQANTFSAESLAYLWLAIENRKSIFVGGTAGAGRLETLNALTTFIPGDARVASVGKQHDFDLRHGNHLDLSTTSTASGEPPSSRDLLEAATRHDPDFLVHRGIDDPPADAAAFFRALAEVRGGLTTVAVNSLGELIKRCTTPPMDISKTETATMDLVLMQYRTRVGGRSVRRNKNLTEVNHYDAENDEINVKDIYQWQAETDEFLVMNESNTADSIRFDRGWSRDRFDDELARRQTVLEDLAEADVTDQQLVRRAIDGFQTHGADVLEHLG